MTKNLPIPSSAFSGQPFQKGVMQFRFEPTDAIRIDDIEYASAKKAPEGYVLRRLEQPEICEEFTHAELFTLQAADRLVVIRNFHRKGKALARLGATDTALTDLEGTRMTKWSVRHELCEAFLAAEAENKVSRSDKSMSPFIMEWLKQKIVTEMGRFGSVIDLQSPPSPTALRRWLRRYEACDFDPMALVDGHGRSGNRGNRLHPDARERMDGWVEKYKSNLKPSIAQLYREMRTDFRLNARHLSVPSRNTFARAIKQLDPFHVLAAREGEAVARRKLYAVRAQVDVSRPLQRVELDEQMIPLQSMLVERGLWDTLPEKLKYGVSHSRVWLSKLIDVYSRVVLGFVLTPAPSTASALATLRMGLEDKTELARSLGCETDWNTFGIPEVIVTDSGRNFRSKSFRAAVLDLGVDIKIAPAGFPQMRGTVERSFRTDNQRFYSMFPGRTFSDVVAKGEYDSEANIALTQMELARLLVRYFVDVYHNTPHGGLGGETPIEAWNRGVARFGVLPPPSKDVIRHVFSTPVECRVGNRGVRVAGLHYQCLALQNARRQLMSKPVLVRVDTDDLGHVSVRTADGWLTVPCSTSGFDGVSVDTWREVQADLRRRHASVAALSEDVVHRAIADITGQIEQYREKSGLPSPIMSSQELVAFDRELSRGFGMLRPEDGPATLIDGNTSGLTEVLIEPGGDNDSSMTAVEPDSNFFTE